MKPKLTPDTIAAIREDYRNRVPILEISRKYKTSNQTINRHTYDMIAAKNARREIKIQQVFELREEGMDWAEIARTVEVSKNTPRIWCQKWRPALLESLAKRKQREKDLQTAPTGKPVIAHYHSEEERMEHNERLNADAKRQNDAIMGLRELEGWERE